LIREHQIVLIGIGLAHGTQKVCLLFVLAENGLISIKSIFRVWLFWRTPKPYGSIIFNDGTVSNGDNTSLEDDSILIIGPHVEDTKLEGNEARNSLKEVYWAE
jgi:hypothetical protein